MMETYIEYYSIFTLPNVVSSLDLSWSDDEILAAVIDSMELCDNMRFGVQKLMDISNSVKSN